MFVGAPTIGTIGVGAVDADESDAVWLTATDYLTPDHAVDGRASASSRKC